MLTGFPGEGGAFYVYIPGISAIMKANGVKFAGAAANAYRRRRAGCSSCMNWSKHIA